MADEKTGKLNTLENSNSSINIIMERLGGIVSKVESLEKSVTDAKTANDKNNNRVTLALIGVVAAQIGVKVLGTPILLDIATFIGIIGVFILFGALIFGIKIIKRTCSLTRTGKILLIMVTGIGIVQIAVYFRDLGYISVDVIYILRIIQNAIILMFAWMFIKDNRITIEKGNEPDCDR